MITMRLEVMNVSTLWRPRLMSISNTVESPVDVDRADSEQAQTTATHPTDQPGNRRRTTADREVASTLTSPGDQQMLTRAQRMEREARAERARLAERQRLEQQIRKKAKKAEKRRRKKDRKRQATDRGDS
jgi:septal ring factor EnvC (AmiA/AmiB activator)